jgi:CRISPR-associated protein Csh1
MILDLLEVYRKNADGDALVIDNYQLKEGLYFKVYGQHKEPEILHVEKKGYNSGELWKFMKAADFYSQLVDMNKPVDPKKQIHSNNIYAVAFKAAALMEDANAVENFKVSIARYYQALRLPKKEDANILKNYHFPPLDEQVIKYNQEYVLSLITYLQQQIIEYKIKGTSYVKLYFAVELTAYMQESKRYLIPKIFNKNDYNVTIGDTTYGLSNSNMGLNAKKPFLEHKTTAFKVPFRFSVANALETRKMFTWLDNQQDDAGKALVEGYLPIGSSDVFTLVRSDAKPRDAHYLHLERGAQPVIDEYDFLPGLTDQLMPTLKLENFLLLDDFTPKNIHSKAELESIVDDWLFNKNLIRNYFNKSPKPNGWLSSFQIGLLIRYRDALRNYFRKDVERDVVSCIDQLSQAMLKEMLLRESYPKLEDTKIAKGLNLRLSLLTYFKIKEKVELGNQLVNLAQGLKAKLITDKTDEILSCENDKEFYYYAGQLVRYLISKSQAYKPTYAIIDHVVDAKDVSKFKQEIIKLHKKYSHALGWNNIRYNRLLAAVMGYECLTEKESGFDLFLAGAASPNIIYFKETEGENNNAND